MTTSNNTASAAAAASLRRPSAFLSLVPDMSTSFPREQDKDKASSPTTEVPATAAVAEPAPIEAGVKRRTSSVDSDGAKSNAHRILKLGPVHWGEHQGDHKGDWHDVAVE